MTLSAFNKAIHSISAAMTVILLLACQAETVDNVIVSEAKWEELVAPDSLTRLTIPEAKVALENGDITSEALVNAYLKRIAVLDHSGPNLQSVLSLNPDALAAARQSDKLREAGETLGPLHGIPILLKDNIETKDELPTTAGAFALLDNVTGRDAPLVAGLRAEGAIILGKTNLSQWANFRSNDSMSGWSAVGGQTRNPHFLDRNPCGSSSGSGAGIAAFMASGAVGTETNGSIICPSNANGIVGFKPTVGLVSQKYIVPISSSQDTAGPMTRSVEGAAIMLGAMDNRNLDYSAMLDADAINGLRIGVLRFAEGSNPDIRARFNTAIEKLESMGGIITEIEEFSPATENFWGKALDVLKYEFKATLDEYLADTPKGVKTRSLAEVIAFNKNSDTELVLFGQDLLESSDDMRPLSDEDYLSKRDDVQRATRADGIDHLLAENNVDVLIAPSGPVAGRIDPINGDVWPSWAGAGYLAAIAGYPNLTVPMGDIDGMPIGLSFMGAKDKDGQILSYGYAYEKATGHIKAPEFLQSAEDRDDIITAMSRKIK